VKFNFPMAYTTTVLAWGVMQYGQAYDTIGEMANVKSAIKWATDYFIKCHVSKFELYGQVSIHVTERIYPKLIQRTYFSCCISSQKNL